MKFVIMFYDNNKDMEIEMKDVDQLNRHPIHKEMNVERLPEELEVLDDSIKRHGKVAPILYVNIDIDGKSLPHVVDGWSAVVIAREKGIEKLPCLLVDEFTEEELPELIANLQTTQHNDPEEDFKRFDFFYKRYSKGRGFRSDLEDNMKKN